MHSSPLPTPFLTGPTSTYRWLPMSLIVSACRLLTFLTKRPTETFDFSARSPIYRSSLSLSALSTPAQHFYTRPTFGRKTSRALKASSCTYLR